MPDAQCTRSPVCSEKSTRVGHHRFTGTARHSLRDGVTAYSALFPVTGLLATVIGAMRKHVANLASASGCQNHTASPSAFAALVGRAKSVHRIPPHVRDDRDTPSLLGRDGWNQ